jgi:RNA polymerase sigma-70 factor (ECF subfamily)
MRGAPRESLAGEQALIERAQQGDRFALSDLYQRHANEVLQKAILPLVHERALALDLLADTFVRAIENLDRYRWQGGGLLPWLIRIARNLCFGHLRFNQRFVAWPEYHEFTAEFDVEGLLDHTQQADLANAQVDACMALLSPRYRAVISLRLIEQQPRAEAAALLGLNVNTLDVLLCRACKAFRKHWVAQYGARPNAGAAAQPKVRPHSA